MADLKIVDSPKPSLEELALIILEKLDNLEKAFARYEPLLMEAERRMAGPLSFGRRKS